MWTSSPTILDNFNDAINKMAEGFVIDYKNWVNSSKIIPFIKTQRTLDSFL